MAHKLFAVFDKAALTYGLPVTLKTYDEAKRAFAEVVNGEGKIHDYPEDFKLVHIGDYDETTGEIHAQVPPMTVCHATELVNDGHYDQEIARINEEVANG